MLVSLDWIKDFVKIPELSPEELGFKFTMATAEVEEVKVEGAFWKIIKIAEITHVERHPNAEKLNLVSFKLSDSESFQVVCGAANVRIGLRVAFAPIGTTLPIGFTLEPKKIRGILSEGMLCSKEELGLEDSSEGIWELPHDTVLGMSLKDYLGVRSDVILDIDNKSLTHRPDLWGHYGLAREFATIFEQPLQNRFDKSWYEIIEASFSKDQSPITPQVDGSSSSLGYWGISLDGIEVKASPDWLQNRLLAVGLRPINNIVDVSNYIMLELGMPMHIFDRDLIKDNVIHIHQVQKQQAFVTLDDEQRTLEIGDTVISDSEKPLVVAGIMGGLNSGVTEQSSKIFIEVANWKAASVRKTSTVLGLRTDSSMRYEKSLDSLLLKRTLYRAIELVNELCPDAVVVGKAEYDGPSLEAIESLTITSSFDKIKTVLGITIDNNKIEQILISLGFGVTIKESTIEVLVPSYRATKDVEFEADLIEEIGRIVGYDNIPISSPRLDIAPVKLSPAQSLQKRIKEFLVARKSCYEVISYPLIGSTLLEKAQWKGYDKLKLVNALTKDAEMMRPSLVPQMLNMVATNQKNFDQFRIFELGRVYLPNEKEFSVEQTHLAIAYFSKSETPFMSLQDSCFELIQRLNLPADICDKHPKFKSTVVAEEWRGIHPYEYQNIRLMGRMEGAIFSIHPLLLKQFKIKGNVSIAILNLGNVEDKKIKLKADYKPLPKFPGSVFDWTVVKKNNQEFGDIFKGTNKVKIKELVSLKIADVFIYDDETSYITLSASFLDAEKTLKGDFLAEAQDKLVAATTKAGFPLKS